MALPSCDAAQSQACLERQEYNEHHIYAEPVPACWWMRLINATFQENGTGTRLEDQLASLSVPFAHKPLWSRTAHPSRGLSAGAFLGKGPQQSRVSAVTCKSFKIQF